MNNIALNLLLGIVWMFLQASFSLSSFSIGLVIGFLALAILERAQGKRDYVHRVGSVFALAGFFLFDLVKSNVLLARDILRPTPSFEPALLSFAVVDLSPAATVLLTNLISLTPGTLTIDAEEGGRVIYVHSLYARDPDAVRQRIDRLATMIRRTTASHQDRI